MFHRKHIKTVYSAIECFTFLSPTRVRFSGGATFVFRVMIQSCELSPAIKVFWLVPTKFSDPVVLTQSLHRMRHLNKHQWGYGVALGQTTPVYNVMLFIHNPIIELRANLHHCDAGTLLFTKGIIASYYVRLAMIQGFE